MDKQPTPASVDEINFDMRIKVSNEIDKLVNGLLYPQIVKEKIYYIAEQYSSQQLEDYKKFYNDRIENLQKERAKTDLQLEGKERENKELHEHNEKLSSALLELAEKSANHASQLQSQLLQTQTEVKELRKMINKADYNYLLKLENTIEDLQKECEYWKALAEAAGKVLGYVPTYGQLNVPFARIDGFLEDRKAYDKLKNQKQIT